MGFGDNLTGVFIDLINSQFGYLYKLGFLTLLIVFYAVFIFYFYRYLAKKNLIELNLSQYNKYSDGFFVKVIPIVLYILEYIIILPILTFFWFTVLAVLIFFLSEDLALDTVLLISAALVASVRMTSYVSEGLSQDLAKMIPFTLLGIALTKPSFFVLSTHFARIGEITSVLTQVIYYLAFIIIIEFIMRVLDLSKGLNHAAKAFKRYDDEDDE